MSRWEGSRALRRGAGVGGLAGELRESGLALASARGLSKIVLRLARALSLTAQARQPSSAPRETRTPTRDTPDKALNLASGRLSESVQIVRSRGISRTI